MGRTIDLNADLGEGCGDDAALMSLVSSANIACGGHAGDADTMRAAIGRAKLAGVAAGAHPSYPDREGFGRRPGFVGFTELSMVVAVQIRALRDVAAERDMKLSHVKPHGALYHEAHSDVQIAEMLVDISRNLLPGAKMFGPPGGALEKACRNGGVTFVAEGFADRAYTAEGTLVPRKDAGAIIEESARRTAQALRLAAEGRVETSGGRIVDVPVDTICLHGDSPGAVESAHAIVAALTEAGLEIRAP